MLYRYRHRSKKYRSKEKNNFFRTRVVRVSDTKHVGHRERCLCFIDNTQPWIWIWFIFFWCRQTLSIDEGLKFENHFDLSSYRYSRVNDHLFTYGCTNSIGILSLWKHPLHAVDFLTAQRQHCPSRSWVFKDRDTALQQHMSNEI